MKSKSPPTPTSHQQPKTGEKIKPCYSQLYQFNTWLWQSRRRDKEVIKRETIQTTMTVDCLLQSVATESRRG